MTDEVELDRLLDAFFVAGSDEVADRVIDGALDEIDQTPQRRVGRMPRRLTMKTSTRVAAAAVIGALAVGGILLVSGPGQSLIAGPSSTPATAASPAIRPSRLPARARQCSAVRPGRPRRTCSRFATTIW